MVFHDFRFLHDCPECFWTRHEGYRWERAASVSIMERQDACKRFALTWEKLQDGPEGGGLVGLGEPPVASCKSVFAQGGGKCWASSIFFLLTGKKSG